MKTLYKNKNNKQLHLSEIKLTKLININKKLKNRIDIKKKIKRLDTCTLTYIHSISDQKKRFLKGKCKQVTHSKQGTMLHVVSKYFNTLLVIRYPVYSPKCSK